MSSDNPLRGSNRAAASSRDPIQNSGPAHTAANPGNGPESPAFVFQPMANMPAELSIADIRRRVQVLLRIVRQRWWLGLLGAIAIGAPLAILILIKPVEQGALTTVLVESTLDNILDRGSGANALIGEDPENAISNHISTLNSRTFRIRVAAAFTPEEALEIQQPYLKSGQEPSEGFLAGLVSGLIAVGRERGRPFFTISARHRNEDTAVLMVGRFSDEFRRYLQDAGREARGEAARILRRQADTLSKEITDLAAQLREYRQENNLITVEENQNILAERLRRINSALSDLRVDRVRLETQIVQAEKDLARSPTPFDNPVLSVFGNLQQLRVDLDRLRNEQAGLANTLGPNHPAMQEANRNLAVVEENIASGFRLAMQDLLAKLELSKAQQQQMSDELTSTFNQSLELDKLAGGFKRLSEELAAKDKALGSLMQQIEETDMGAQRPTEGMRTIDPPFGSGASTRQRMMMFAGVAVLSLLAFFGLPLGTYIWSERLSGSMDLEDLFKKQVLAVLPKFTGVAEDDRPHIVRDNVELPHVETYLSLVAQFELISRTSGPRQILITSTVPGEGKSMNASNLAATFTRFGHKTVLVDCDFRRPVQQRFHRVEHDEGFLAWAARGFPLTEDLLKPGGPVGLSILPDGTSLIPAGGVDVQPGHVLVARPVAELFRRLAQAFDVVIIDSPPAGVFQDALLLARYCAESIVFVREGRAFSSQLKRVLEDLEKTPAPAVGLVLNVSSLKNVHPSVGSRYGYGKYGYGKDYSNNYSYKAKAPPTTGQSQKIAARVVGREVVKV